MDSRLSLLQQTWPSNWLRELSHFGMKPSFEHCGDIGLLIRGEGTAAWYPMPFLQATAAAAGCCMLRNKDWMTPKRGLFPIILRHGGGQAFCDKVPGMVENGWQALGLQIDKIFSLEVKFSAESRL